MTLRRKYIVHQKFQKDFTVKVFAAIFGPVLISLAFFIVMIIMAQAASVSPVNPLTDGKFWFAFLLRVVPVSFIIFVVAIFFSHRIAGPIRKMQIICDQLSQGVKPQQITLRKKDYFHGFAGKLNRAFNPVNPK
ncbi:MAG: hypothetical protein NTW14_04810 [bacterium]|nr:hypothetical protein [bacterium]